MLQKLGFEFYEVYLPSAKTSFELDLFSILSIPSRNILLKSFHISLIESSFKHPTSSVSSIYGFPNIYPISDSFDFFVNIRAMPFDFYWFGLFGLLIVLKNKEGKLV
jgi:hypothetical protein